MSIEMKEIEYEPFGRCIKISNRVLEAIISIDFGPRILKFNFLNEENTLYEDKQDRHVYQNEILHEYFGKDAKFHCYGGHRLSVAPDVMPQSYYPDNEPVVYGPINGGVTFTSPRQQDSELEFSMDIMMSDGTSDIMVVHKLKNCSSSEKNIALAGITMTPKDGLLIVPQNRGHDEKHYPNRHLSLWPFSSFRDPRLFVGDRYLTVKHAAAEQYLKFGINDVQGWVVYVRNHTALMARFIHNTAFAYPDFGASFESYVCNDYTEMRVLSPLYTAAPGKIIRHVENLSLFHVDNLPNAEDEDAIENFCEQLAP